MLSVQQLAEIAARHLTRMADAMVAACVARSLELGEPLEVREPRQRPAFVGTRPEEDVDWERMVWGNSDSRGQHV